MEKDSKQTVMEFINSQPKGLQDILVAIGVVELKPSVYMVWRYPMITETELISRHCESIEQGDLKVIKSEDGIVYLHRYSESSVFVFIMKTFEYEEDGILKLMHVLEDLYEKHGPVKLLESYLALFATSKIGQDWQLNRDLVKSNEVANQLIQELIRRFGKDVVKLWHGMLLKKKIVVFSVSHLNLLYRIVKSLRFLVSHRKSIENMANFFPLLNFDDPEERNILKDTVFYVVGTQQSSASSRKDLCDIFVNLETNEIQFSQDSDYITCKQHEDVEKLLLSAKEENIHEELRQLTFKIAASIHQIAQKPDFNQQKLLELCSNNVDQARFFWQCAISENLIQLS